MKILRIALLLMVLGCERAPDRQIDPDTAQAPLGPGTEPSALTPPDTPMTSATPKDTTIR